METFIQQALGLAALVAIIGFIIYLMFRALQKSEEPAWLLGRWGLTLLIVTVGTFVAAKLYSKGFHVAAFGVPITVAVVCVILGILWAPSWGAMIAKPITGIFDGGSEVERKPLYSIAEANRKRGRYRKAIAEAECQLEQFPADLQGTLLVADIYASDLDSLDQAIEVLEEFLTQPDLPSNAVSVTLNRLADVHLKHRRDPDGARAALERIQQRLPDSREAIIAAQRIAHLASKDYLEDQRSPQRVELKPGEDRVGLKGRMVSVEPRREEPAELAAKYVAHLQQHPLDIDTRENLALLYIDHYNRLDLALDQFEELIALPKQTSRQIVKWLNRIADIQLKQQSDIQDARKTLERIIALFPGTAHAAQAQNRMAHLNLEARSQQKSQGVKLG